MVQLGDDDRIARPQPSPEGPREADAAKSRMTAIDLDFRAATSYTISFPSSRKAKCWPSGDHTTERSERAGSGSSRASSVIGFFWALAVATRSGTHNSNSPAFVIELYFTVVE